MIYVYTGEYQNIFSQLVPDSFSLIYYKSMVFTPESRALLQGCHSLLRTDGNMLVAVSAKHSHLFRVVLDTTFGEHHFQNAIVAELAPSALACELTGACESKCICSIKHPLVNLYIQILWYTKSDSFFFDPKQFKVHRRLSDVWKCYTMSVCEELYRPLIEMCSRQKSFLLAFGCGVESFVYEAYALNRSCAFVTNNQKEAESFYDSFSKMHGKRSIKIITMC